MKTNITYILGAGASCDTLPLANDLRNRMEALRNSITTLLGVISNAHADIELLKIFNADINQVLIHSSRHQTIDTYAKMLYLTKDLTRYKKLIEVLTIYFMFEQLKVPHSRYDHFIATLLEEQTLKLPDNFTFLSWNYDYQFEKSISLYTKYNDYKSCAKHLKLFSLGVKDKCPVDTTFFKLNGTALFDKNKATNEFNPVFIEFDDIEKKIKYIIDFYREYCRNADRYSTSLTFAWTKNKENVLDLIYNKISNTEILVIIGYSFPYFNRDIDLKILQSMKDLKKIVIQTVPETSDQHLTKMKALWPHDKHVDIEIVTDNSQFYIPYEFNAVKPTSQKLTDFFS